MDRGSLIIVGILGALFLTLTPFMIYQERSQFYRETGWTFFNGRFRWVTFVNDDKDIYRVPPENWVTIEYPTTPTILFSVAIVFMLFTGLQDLAEEDIDILAVGFTSLITGLIGLAAWGYFLSVALKIRINSVILTGLYSAHLDKMHFFIGFYGSALLFLFYIFEGLSKFRTKSIEPKRHARAKKRLTQIQEK